MPDYAAHEAVYFSQAITADDFAMKKNPKYVNKVVAPTLEPISSIGGFRTLPDYSFDTMPDDYVALVLIGGFGWNTPVAENIVMTHPNILKCSISSINKASVLYS